MRLKLDWPHIFFAAEVWKINDAVMGWRLVEIVSVDTGIYMYSGPKHPVDKLEEADTFLEGSLRFDGCCNFQTPVGNMSHVCNIETEFANLFEAMKLLQQAAINLGVK